MTNKLQKPLFEKVINPRKDLSKTKDLSVRLTVAFGLASMELIGLANFLKSALIWSSCLMSVFMGSNLVCKDFTG
ncbi:MAG: hypothetical protein SFU25_01200 [Candidatus Caenarcaniphilales bacterium]|nr:hypothetical protein [Candidatus Caenarcaniphilales bacterium]